MIVVMSVMMTVTQILYEIFLLLILLFDNNYYYVSFDSY
jgi:hypothetical protein